MATCCSSSQNPHSLLFPPLQIVACDSQLRPCACDNKPRYNKELGISGTCISVPKRRTRSIAVFQQTKLLHVLRPQRKVKKLGVACCDDDVDALSLHHIYVAADGLVDPLDYYLVEVVVFYHTKIFLAAAGCVAL
jgi:hypothetical protein